MNTKPFDWTKYQKDIYATFKPPPFTTKLNEMQDQAQKVLEHGAYWYIAGAAGTGKTDVANKDAFDDWRIIPRALVDSNVRDLRTTIFGVEYSSPVIMAPVGVHELWHPEGEEASARAAKSLGIPICMSTAATRSIEKFAECNGDSPRWYQLYWPINEEITASLLSRAKAQGFTTLVVTLDTTLLGHRPNDLDTSTLPFLKGIGSQVGFSDPVWCKKMGIEPTEHYTEVPEANGNRLKLAIAWQAESFSGVFRTWKDIAPLRKLWDGPIVLKGIQNVEDARMAIGIADGIIVSNHGGRQVDGAISSLSALAAITADPIVAASDLTILFDSGIRCGTDVIKALALGAKAVLVGRPYIYGLAIGGEKGVEHVMRTLLSEVETNAALMGCSKTSELTRDRLQYVGRGSSLL